MLAAFLYCIDGIVGLSVSPPIIGWIDMKLWTDIQDPQRTKPVDFNDRLAFSLAPPAGPKFEP